eukprot:6206131-Pleurochrysis_carterae.AAC.2
MGSRTAVTIGRGAAPLSLHSMTKRRPGSRAWRSGSHLPHGVRFVRGLERAHLTTAHGGAVGWSEACVRACVCLCVCACVCARARACLRARMRACVRACVLASVCGGVRACVRKRVCR